MSSPDLSVASSSVGEHVQNQNARGPDAPPIPTDKNIVICLDGTGNSFDNPETNSNVVKFYAALEINQFQFGYYHPGVGTMGAPSTRGAIGKKLAAIKGLAFGEGLMANVADAYRYLMNTFRDGDRIFLIGFSRGSFTARTLASVIHVFGLLCPGNEGLIPYVLSLYQKMSKAHRSNIQTFEPDEAFKWTFAHRSPVNIHFCGLWDTVSSYGWAYSPIELPFLGVNPVILTGRHAISIHERRCYYQANLWGTSDALRQVWFAGVHSDVGGSYPEKQSGLSKIPLEWMFQEAAKSGIALNATRVRVILGLEPPSKPVPQLPAFVPTNENAPLHDSLQRYWRILELLPHFDPTSRKQPLYIPRGRSRNIPEGSLIHESVLKSEWKPTLLPPHQVEPWIQIL